MIGKLSKELPFVLLLALSVAKSLPLVLLLALSAAKSLPLVYSSSRNTRVFRHEIRAQSETCLHREYNLAMKNKASGGSQTCAVEGAYAPRTSRQERRGVLEFSQAIAKVCASWELYEHSNGFRARNF